MAVTGFVQCASGQESTGIHNKKKLQRNFNDNYGCDLLSYFCAVAELPLRLCLCPTEHKFRNLCATPLVKHIYLFNTLRLSNVER